MRSRQHQIDQECLAHVASMYYASYSSTSDHRRAFIETVRSALLSGYQPYAVWVSDAMLRTGRPAFAVILSHPEASMAFPVIVGGVSIGWADQLIESESYTTESGRGWRLIEGETLDLYRRWARQEPEPQIELERGMGR